MTTSRFGYAATLLPNGNVLVAGGHNGSSYITGAELYDPATGTWTATGSMSGVRGYHTATLLPSGNVLVAGGQYPSSYLSSAELYIVPTLTITLNAAANGQITGNDSPYFTNSSAALTAVASPGYAFTGWTGAATGTTNPLSLLMDGDKTIGATFTRQYTLTTSALTNGTITGVASDGKYLTGTTATVTAVPAAGYAFTGWTGAATGTTNPLSLLMDGNKTIGATFTRQYTLTTSALSNGTISGVASDGKYLTGTSATLTAVPSDGYAFTGWTGAATGATNPLSLLMNANKTLGATFTRQYTLTTSALSNGTITGLATGGKYLTGTSATLTAVPDAGYAFTGWTGEATGTTNPLSVLMNSDKSIGAVFTRQYILTTSGSNGTVTGGGKYLTGTTATLTAVPNAGYVFTGWTDNATGTTNPLSLLMDGDKTIGATFTRQYTLTTSALSNGTITDIATDGKYLTGTSATLTAVPSAGYVFTGWTGDATGTTNPLPLLMNSDKTIGATFGPDTFDSDGDGLSNYLEAVTYGTNPDIKDTDGDGLTDAWEVGVGRFSIIAGSFTWEQARADAHARGGELACFPTVDRWNRAMESLGAGATDNFVGLWIGASDATTEGTWTWVNGEPFTFSNWATGRPSIVTGNTLDYAEISGGGGAELGKWYDRTATFIRDGYILETGYATDPLVADVDGDGLNDGAEQTAGTNPFLPDTDGDGLTDGQEVNLHHTNPKLTDSDGDGFYDGAEVEFYSNPLSPDSLPEFKARTVLDTGAGILQFRFLTQPGKLYTLEASTDLVGWDPLETGIAGTGGTLSRNYPLSSATARWFRAKRE